MLYSFFAKLNSNMIILLSIIIGTLYYQMMEASVPIESNCTFISTIWTDIIAFIAGIFLIDKSFIHNDNTLLFIGCIIIVEHIWQLLPKYQIPNSLYKIKNNIIT